MTHAESTSEDSTDYLLYILIAVAAFLLGCIILVIIIVWKRGKRGKKKPQEEEVDLQEVHVEVKYISPIKDLSARNRPTMEEFRKLSLLKRNQNARTMTACQMKKSQWGKRIMMVCQLLPNWRVPVQVNFCSNRFNVRLSFCSS